MKKYVIFLLFLIGYFELGFAQPTNDIKRYMREANGYFKIREYLSAIPLYHQVLKMDSQYVAANFQLGISYLKAQDKNKSLSYLQKVRRLSPDYSPILDFYLGEAFRYNNAPQTAINFYKKMRQIYNGKAGKVIIVNDQISNRDFVNLIDQRIQEATYGIRFLADPTNADIENIGAVINSEHSDYGPVISGDESVLIFTSRRENTTGGGRSREDNQFYEDIYISYRENDNWSKPKKIGSNINTKFNEASIALSNDGQELFIYEDDNGGDIYTSELKGKRNWSRPKNLDANINSRYHEPSASITDDGKTIYFSSDRPGGLGGLDIYKCEKDEKGNWSEPENLGPIINTPKDDDAPFIHYDRKTLYFSSRGHRGLGGYDIFYSELINGNWTSPVNLGYPINTPDEDVHFVLSANYKTGYYSSVQPGGFGSKDIYVVRMPDYRDVEIIDFQLSIKTVAVGFNPLITNDPKKAIVILRGVVRDEFTDELISARMTLTDVEENKVVDEINSISPKGVYFTTMFTGRKYLLYVQKEGYLYHSEYFEIPVGVVNQEKVINIYLRRLRKNESIEFRALFDYNSARLKRQSYPALETLVNFLETNSRLKIRLEGHTDSIGTAERNLELSQQRARSVYEYLIRQGIDEDRLAFVGYGESQPIASNETPFGRSLNRRTEFRILEEN